jgi:hypothetical protein
MAIRSVDRRSVYPTGNLVRRALLTLRGEGVRSFWFKLLAQMGYRRLLLRTHHLRQLQRAGHRRVVVAVLPENASSLRDILKGGYRPCAIIGRIKVGRWQRHFRKALSKV